ncbi:hypothetical protein GIB67_035409 [Kingdonia uniflora]|uniref:Transcription repressor n=1 Tax=Kingdonia uniflora TaxID=39325 RepID=A0A7J7P092_9MAGN|nr:hypothetical protein GIB67_035409 [Kingdonia uniflora]
MTKNLQETLHKQLSKLKISTPSLRIPSKSFSNSKSWILSGCRHPKTPSFAIVDDKQARTQKDEAAATLSDVDKFLFENFSSLFREEKNKKKEEHDANPNNNGFLFESPKFNIELPPDLRGTHRFFTSPGTSSSLIEEARSSVASNRMSTSDEAGSSYTISKESPPRESIEVKGVNLPDESIALLTYSPAPYDDFRQSMLEMIEARLRDDKHNRAVDWDFMEELLFCYLRLNEKKAYKYILSAFTDVVVKMREYSERAPTHRIPTTKEKRRRNGDVT